MQLRHYLLGWLFKGNIYTNNDFWHFTQKDVSFLARKNPALGADAPETETEMDLWGVFLLHLITVGEY